MRHEQNSSTSRPTLADASSAYRDRANERRKGISSEYAGSEAIAAQLQTESAALSIEQSQYLGGDEQHTHLVKGLDYALLRKVRLDLGKKDRRTLDGPDESSASCNYDISSLSKADVELLQRLNNEQAIGEKATFLSPFAMRVVSSATRKSKALPMNELFAPGRLAFLFNVEHRTEADMYEAPTTIIRSKADCVDLCVDAKIADNEIVLGKVIALLHQIRIASDPELARRLQKQEKKRKDKYITTSTTTLTKAIVNPILSQPVIDVLVEEDIFGDVGNVYKLETTPSTTVSKESTIDDVKQIYFEKEVEEVLDTPDNMLQSILDTAISQTPQIDVGHTSLEQHIRTSKSVKESAQQSLSYDRDLTDMDIQDMGMGSLVSTNFATMVMDTDQDDSTTMEDTSGAHPTSSSGPSEKLHTRFHFDTEQEWIKYQKQQGIYEGPSAKQKQQQKNRKRGMQLQQIHEVLESKYGMTREQLQGSAKSHTNSHKKLKSK